jgi:hypothetical protein
MTKMVTALLMGCAIACGALPAGARERVHAGQWETTVSIAGNTMTKSSCLSQRDADEINGDEASIKAYVERVSAPAGCKVSDVHIDGDTVSVTSTCASGKQNVGKTTYHGDSFETVNTNGAKATARRVGSCK